MAATLTGTPVAVTWATGANPASQNITIPADATAVYMFWAYFNSSSGNGLASATLNGASPDQTYEVATALTDRSATGVAVWYNPSTGSQALDPAWDATPTEGPSCAVVFVKGGDTTAWRDADAAANSGSTAVTVTLTTVSGDLVLKFDQCYDGADPVTPPSLSSGWTNGVTGGTASIDEAFRLSYISATGSTQVCDSENEEYSTVCAVSIPEASASSAPTLNSASVTNLAATTATANLSFTR